MANPGEVQPCQISTKAESSQNFGPAGKSAPRFATDLGSRGQDGLRGLQRHLGHRIPTKRAILSKQ